MELDNFIRRLFGLSADADLFTVLVAIKEDTIRYEMLMSVDKPDEAGCGTGGCGGCGE